MVPSRPHLYIYIAVFALIIFSGSANVTYTIELERDEKTDLFRRRMFFLDGKRVFFAITQQVTLAKENKSFCEFNHTVYLRVSSSTFTYFLTI